MTREEAIKYIKSRCIGSTEERDGTQWSEAMWTAIEALADRPTGEWIYAKEQLEIVPMWECSCCRTRISKKFNYCPNCGAKMGGDDE